MLAFGIEILTDFIADDAVTNAKLADMAQATIKGRAAGAGTGDPTDLTAAQVKAIITPILTADIGDDQVTYAKMQNISAASRLLGRGDSGAGDPEEIQLGSGLSMSGTTLSATAGTSVAASWRFDTSTTAADPGNQDFRLNNTTLGSVTEIFIDDNTVAGFSIDTLAGFLAAGHRIYIQQNNDSSKAALFQVSGAATDNTGWWTIPVTVLASGTLFDNNQECTFIISFSSTGTSDGDKGDITVSGGGSTFTIDNDVVTFAKMQNIATDRLLGRDTAGTGDPEEIAVGGGIEFTGSASIQTSAFTGDVTKTAGGTALTIANNAVTDAKLRDSGALSVIGRSANSAGDPADISASAASGAVLRESGSVLGFGTIATAGIGDDQVTFAKIQEIATDRLIGRDTAATGNPEEISVGGGIEFTGSTSIQTSAFTGDVTKTAGGTALTIANDAVTFAKMQNIATDRLIGRDTAATGDPEEISVGGGIEFTGSAGIQTSAFTGDVTKTAGGTALTIANNAVTDAKLRDSGALSVIGRAANSTGDPADISASAASGAVLRESGSTLGFGTIATAGLGDDQVTFAKIQEIATDRLIGRDTAATGNPEEISVGGGIEFTGSTSIQTSAFTGDVTKAAGGTALTIANDAVTFAKMQNIATDRLIGRDTAGTGDPEEISLGLDHEFSGSQVLQLKAFTGDVLKSAGSPGTTVISATDTFQLGSSGPLTAPQITADQDNYNPTDLFDSTYLQIQSDAPRNITGIRSEVNKGNPQGRVLVVDNIGAFPITLVDESASSSSGYRFDLPGNLVLGVDETCMLYYTGLRWISLGTHLVTLTGDVTGSGITSVASTIANDAVTNAKLANMATATFKGRTTAGTGDPEDLTGTQATALLDNFVGDSGSGGTKGLVPAPAAGDAAANKFLKANGTWAATAGGGDVVGPGSATDNAVTRFDTTTGKLIQNSGTTLDDNGIMVTAATTAQWVGGAATTQFSVTGVPLSPRIFSHSESALIPNMVMAKYVASATAGANFNFLRSRGSEASKSVVSVGDTLGIVSFLGHDGTDFAIGASIEGRVDSAAANVGAGDMPGKLFFMTSPDGTESPTAKMTIDSVGAIELLNSAAFKNTSLRVLDTDATHALIFKPGSDLTADRTLTITTGDADKTLDFTATTGTGNWVFATTPTLTSPVFAAGSASAASWPKMTSGTVMTTAEAGALEFDGNCFYASPAASKRGVLANHHVICLASTNTLSNSGAEQALFDQTGSGALTLQTGTYRFECLVSLSSMSGTSGNMGFNLLGAGTATVGSVLYMIDGSDNAINAVSANTQFTSNAAAAAGPVVTATTQTALQLNIRGSFRVTGAGTIIPSCTLANAAAAVVAIGSFFECWQIGSSSMQTVGQWS